MFLDDAQGTTDDFEARLILNSFLYAASTSSGSALYAAL
jgi:hypothetical protein